MNEAEIFQIITAQFERTPASELKIDSNFRNISEWDSMVALNIIAAIDMELNVSLSGDDISKSKTFKELISQIKNKL